MIRIDNWLSWVPLILALTVIILTSTFSISSYSFFDQKKIVVSALLIFTSVFFLVFLYKYKLGFNPLIKWSCFIFVVLLIISSLLAPMPEWAFLQVGWYLLVVELLILMAFLYQQDEGQFIQYVLIGVIILCVIYTIRVYGDYISGITSNNWTVWPAQHKIQYFLGEKAINPNAYLGFSHVRFFNHLQTWSLPILVFAFLYYKDNLILGIRYLFLFFISSWWMLVFAADARGTILASFTSIILIAFLFKKRSLKLIKPYLITALVGLALYLVLFLIPKEEARQIFTRFGDSGRIDVWLFSVEKIVQNPIFGLGPMHFSYMGIDPIWSTPHNIILQSAGEWGIPALLIASSLIVVGLYKFIVQSIDIQKYDNQNLLMRIALVTSISSALAHSMVSGIFNSPLSQLMCAIISGWILGEFFLREGEKLFLPRTKKSIVSVLLISVMAINTLFVGYQVASEIPYLGERKHDFFNKFNTYTLYPRFWNQGMIYKGQD